MQMAFKNGVRIRLSFEEEGMLSEAQIEQGLNKSWYLVNPQILTIGQLSAWITVEFRLGNSCPNGVTLEMSGFALPPTQPTTILQEAELVSVKRKLRLTAEELAYVAAVAKSALNAKSSGNGNGVQFGAVEIRPKAGASEFRTRIHQNEIVEKGGNKRKLKAVEIGLQLLRSKETVRRQKRMHETDIPLRGKEVVADLDANSDLERPTRKDATETSGDGSPNKQGEQPERNEDVLPKAGDIYGRRTPLTEEEQEDDESSDQGNEPNDMVGSPEDHQLVVSPSHDMIGQPMQERPHRRRGRTRQNPSEGNDTWCRNRFDVWRKQQGMDTSKTIEEMPYEELGAVLSNFFLMICKDNGQRYPSASLMNLFMSFGRIIGKAQQERIKKDGSYEEPFRIQTHPVFQKAGQSCQKAMELSQFSGVNKRPKKAACISLEVEKLILAHPEHQATFPTGVQKRLAYYLWTVFLIRGNEEMWNLKFHDFSICVDEKGVEFLQYNVRATRKHFKVIMTKSQDKLVQPPASSYDADVLRTFRILALHMPPDSVNSHLFLSPIRDARTVVWFKQGVNVSKGMIRLWMNTMTEVVGLDGKSYSSKSKRVGMVSK